MNPPNDPVSQQLQRLSGRLIAWTGRLVTGRFWWLKVFLLCVAFSVLFSGGLDFGLGARGGYPESYFRKIDQPLLDVGRLYGLNSHDANINFRLTVPVLLHVAGIRAHWVLPVLTVLAICTILIASCFVAERITGDRVCAAFIALNVSATYVGSFSFIWYYDAIAIAQLTLACLPGMQWWLRALLVFTAAFTDERAWAASGLLLAGGLIFAGGSGDFFSRLRRPGLLAIGAGMAAYAVGRLALMKLAGLSSPTGGNGPGMLIHNFNFLHPAVWYSLEGGWLFYLLAVFTLLVRRDFWPGATLVLVSLGFLGFALMIGDVLRSTIYIFPLLFICLNVVRQHEALPVLRIYCLLAFLISALGGNYNVYLAKITWFQPLAIHWLQGGAQFLYEKAYALLPHTMATPVDGAP